MNRFSSNMLASFGTAIPINLFNVMTVRLKAPDRNIVTKRKKMARLKWFADPSCQKGLLENFIYNDIILPKDLSLYKVYGDHLSVKPIDVCPIQNRGYYSFVYVILARNLNWTSQL